MYYVYILYSFKDKRLYIGCTKDLKNRIQLHNQRKIVSTKNRIPVRLVFYEAFFNKQDAFAREKWLKSGWGRRHLKQTLQNSMTELRGKF